MTPALELRGVSVDYGDTRALAGVDLTVAEGETVALLGPSGSGKTTLIHAVAGFVPLAAGEIDIGGETVATAREAAPPEQRGIGVVFQNYALWPHMDAVDIVAYPLRRGGMARASARDEAAKLMARLGIGELADRRPAQLSGGQQQRVGLARALARRAALYLFDEPTAHLDAAVAQAAQEEIRRARRYGKAAAIHSTHDATEALALADRVVLLRAGSVIQAGTPMEVYRQPKDLWAARLTGPASVLAAVADGSAVRVEGTAVENVESAGAEGEVELLVRPDWVRPGGGVNGIVMDVFFRGAHTDYRVSTGAGQFVARVAGTPMLEPGEATGWEIQEGWIFGRPSTDTRAHMRQRSAANARESR